MAWPFSWLYRKLDPRRNRRSQQRRSNRTRVSVHRRGKLSQDRHGDHLSRQSCPSAFLRHSVEYAVLSNPRMSDGGNSILSDGYEVVGRGCTRKSTNRTVAVITAGPGYRAADRGIYSLPRAESPLAQARERVRLSVPLYEVPCTILSSAYASASAEGKPREDPKHLLLDVIGGTAELKTIQH